MNQEIKRIIKAIEAAYDGKGWFGDNLLQQLEGVDAVKACKVPEKLNHSIAEIIQHILAWRIFVIEKLNGNATYEVWDTELNWVKISSLDEENWLYLKQKLKENQQLLTQTIQQKAEELLEQNVDGRSYNFRLMLQGITQHDIYHIGQISLIKKLVS